MLKVTGSEHITSNLDVSGTLGVTGNTTIGGTLGVTGATTITGVLNANGGIKCDTNRFVVADVSGATGIGGNVSTEMLKVYGTSNITGNTGIGGTPSTSYMLKVTGSEHITSNLDVSGTLGVTGNTTIGGTLTVIGVTNAYIPRGIIVMWSGNNNNIPTGWILCNGSNGTPDLRNRFIIGSGSTYTTSNTGGNSTVTLVVENIPSHRHSGTTDSNGSHSHSGTTDSNGNHSHAIQMKVSSSSGLGQGKPVAANLDQNSQDTSTFEAGSHTHTFNTVSNGSHNHGFNTDYTGSGTAFNILPPYYSLAYIMKT